VVVASDATTLAEISFGIVGLRTQLAVLRVRAAFGNVMSLTVPATGSPAVTKFT
jgi:hypothetical protein